MRRITRLTVNPFGALGSRIRLGGVSWSRLAIMVEMLAFLTFAVALTIAPQITLDSVAGLANRASSYAVDARPAVAAFGLILVGLAVLGLRAMARRRQAEPVATRPIEFKSGQPAARDAA